MKSVNIILYYTFVQCLFVNAKTSFININVLILRLGEIYYLGLLSQNVAQIPVKIKIYCIIKGFASLALSYLVMWKTVQALQSTVPMPNV